MKLRKFIYGVVLAAFLITAGSSCRKGQFNINQNVNSPTDSTITYNAVLPAAMNATASLIARSWGVQQNWMSYWSRSGTYAPNVTEETYQITTSFGNGVWNNAYDNAYDYQIIISKASQAGAGFYEGIARIMKTIDFQVLVDVYGNVPYSQALKGSGNPTPSYDNGLDIYKDLLREIDKGILLIRRAVVSTTNTNKDIWSNDILFGVPGTSYNAANVAAQKVKWVKFANTLKLRLLIHAYAVGAIDKAAEMNIINTTTDTTLGTPGPAYGFLGAGEDALINPGYTGIDKPNPFFNQYKTNTDGSASANDVYYKANEWAIEYYKFDGDPRVTNTVVPCGGGRTYVAGSGGLVGVAYGLPPVTANSASVLAGIGPGVYKTATSPQAILTASESLFLQSEARFRNIITSGPTAMALMISAIEQNMIFLGVCGATATNPGPAITAATAYRAANATYPDVDYNGVPQGTGGPAGGLFTILSQKWFAMNGIATLETWTDWRRVPYTEVATNLIFTPAPNDAPTTNFAYGDGGGFPGGPNSPGPGPFRSVSPQITPQDNIPVRYLYPQTEYNYNASNVPQGVTRYSRIFWDLN